MSKFDGNFPRFEIVGEWFNAGAEASSYTFPDVSEKALRSGFLVWLAHRLLALEQSFSRLR